MSARLLKLGALVSLALVAFGARVLFVGAATSQVPLNYPSHRLTPGWLNPDVKQATIGTTICVSGWTATIRPPTSYTGFLKKEELHYRGLPGTVADYQLDHLVSLELGGSAFDTRDLWMESQPQGHVDDGMENRWKADVCAGRLTLRQGQQAEMAWKRAHG